MEYQRLCTVDLHGNPINKGIFIPYGSNPHSYIEDKNKPYYLSTSIYTEEQKELILKNKTPSGITDTTVDKLFFDFDSKDNLDKAKSNAQEMCARLIQHGVDKESILPCFSGAKGFSIEVKIDKRLRPEELKIISSKMAEGLDTFDGSIYDAARIFRIPDTKHQKTGLYKCPLTFEDLNSATIEQIKEVASKEPTDDSWVHIKSIKLPDSILELKRTDTKDRVTTATIIDAVDLDFKHKPKGFSNCKFALMNGFFPDGARHNSMLILASTYRANGFPKEIAYNSCKAALRLQVQRYGGKPFDKEELWSQVIEGVYSSKWNGGQYTCKTDHTLKKICDSLGVHKCKLDSDFATTEPDEVFGMFKNYALNYDKNAIYSGVKSLDEKINFMVGTSSGILAAPGVGKSSLALSILNHNSKNDISSLFFSYDMFHSMLYLRMIQKHFGLQQKDAFRIIKEDEKLTAEIREVIKKEYKNVSFCFKNGQTPEAIDRTIIETEEKTGKKLKLVVVDYNELVVGESADPTQNSAQVAQKLRQIANDRECCVITLLQPSKVFSNPAEEITTHQGAKGSGAIAQSLTLMLSLSRPGFNPRCPEDDRFFTINAVKNRHGALFSIDLSWDGLRGALGELDYDGQNALNALRERKQAEKAEDGSW